jgi:hypothetical protein
MRFFLITISLFCMLTGISAGAGPKISEIGNKHNFSSTNTAPGINFRASTIGDNAGYQRSSQICVFCHTPHRSSGEGALWNRVATTKTFLHYSSTTLRIDDPAMRTVTEYGQPNGSSRLCLSCHDGVTALAAVFTTPLGITNQLQFTNIRTGTTNASVAIGYETYSSHHPVSFKYDANVRSLLNAYNGVEFTHINTDEVKLDKKMRMQCTTCHDPHQDKSEPPSPLSPFWTTTTYQKVCDSCHLLLQSYPWKP